jgi:tetratricopeptide (TPR) repeat protein
VPPNPSDPAEASADEGEVLELLARAEAQLAAEQFDVAIQTARQAADLKVRLDIALPTLARIFEGQGDLIAALDAYEQAVEAAPQDPAISLAMGRLALRLGKHAVAETVLGRHVRLAAASAEAIAELARAQAGLRAFDRAQATLTGALQADPAQPVLWRTLGDLLSLQGRHGEAVVFFEESLRLDPASWAALDGVADAILLSGADDERALEASEAALEHAPPDERARLNANHARRLLAAGRLVEGWAAFAQKVWPGEASAVTVKLAAPRLDPDAPLEGRLVLIGEGDIADEVLLAQAVPSLIGAGVEPILAVDGNWAALARRSFPGALVTALREKEVRGRRWLTAELDSPHMHAGALVGAWAPLRALPGVYRASPEAFADAQPYLTPDPARVAHWRERLGALPPGPKVGLAWRAPDAAAHPWAGPPMAALAAALNVAGVTLIGVQSQDIQGELTWIRETFGLAVEELPPDLPAWNLDEVAALTAALDAVVGLPDKASIVAAACGVETWFLSPPRDWARLGAPFYPWFPKARVMAADGPDGWAGALGELNAALTALVEGSAAARAPG